MTKGGEWDACRKKVGFSLHVGFCSKGIEGMISLKILVLFRPFFFYILV